jgi:hypothetical protein
MEKKQKTPSLYSIGSSELLRYLKVGEKHARTARDISERFNVTACCAKRAIDRLIGEKVAPVKKVQVRQGDRGPFSVGYHVVE